MNSKGIIGISLIAAILLTGCNSSATNISGGEDPAASRIESIQTETTGSGETKQTEATGSGETIQTETAGSAGTTQKDMTGSGETIQAEATASAGSAQTETAAATEHQLYEFNAHLHPGLLDNEIPQDHWDALHNLCDALRKGTDTFECSSKEAYDWCMDPGTLANLFPAACFRITSESSDGTIPFENNLGRIYYKMPPEEYVARQAEFEQMVVSVLNNTLEYDDDDFEKCLKLYDYMESNYRYDYDGGPEGECEDCYTYSTFMTHKGQCIDLAGVYSFLLLEAGVEALNVGCFDNTDHAWAYVLVSGRGYHIDPTWALKAEKYTDALFLDYFMMSDEIRTSTGCPVDDLTVQLLPQFWVKSSSVSLTATDDRYYLGESAVFRKLDEENKIIYYFDTDGVEQKLYYGS